MLCQVPQRSALVILSGGQDSFVSLLLAKEQCAQVSAVTFDYGQQHREVGAAVMIADLMKLRFTCLEIGGAVPGPTPYGLEAKLTPVSESSTSSSFYPLRNLTFLSVAGALAHERGATEIWTGFTNSRSPDCTRAFLESAERTLSLGLNRQIGLCSPLLDHTKAEIFAMAYKRGHLSTMLGVTRSCPHSGQSKRKVWGVGCGECPSCKRCIEGWREFSAWSEEEKQNNGR